MKRISIEQAFSWMQVFVQREWRLLAPVALAFLALPALAVDLLVPPERRVVTTPLDPQQMAGVLAWLLPGVALVVVAGVIGGLTIAALAIVPRISVREAMRIALRRCIVPLGALLLVTATLGVAATAAAFAVLLLGLSPVASQRVVQLLVTVGAVFVSVRLMLLTPLVADRPVGIVDAIRASWAASEGLFGRLLAAAAIFLVGALVVLMAVQWALGGLLLAFGLALGQPELGRALASLVSACASAGVSGVFTVLVTGIYRQVGAPEGRA